MSGKLQGQSPREFSRSVILRYVSGLDTETRVKFLEKAESLEILKYLGLFLIRFVKISKV